MDTSKVPHFYGLLQWQCPCFMTVIDGMFCLQCMRHTDVSHVLLVTLDWSVVIE